MARAPSIAATRLDKHRHAVGRLISRATDFESLRCSPILPLGQGENYYDSDKRQDSKNEDAAFGASGPTAENRLAYRMIREQMMLDHQSAVRNPVKKGLRPIP